MLIDANGLIHHYWGPALHVNFNGVGIVTALEFVGVTGDRNYIDEVWRLENCSQKYKYKKFTNVPREQRRCTGRVDDGPRFDVGDSTWASEAADDAEPPTEFMKQFKPAARTFFINCKTGTFMHTFRRILPGDASCLETSVVSHRVTAFWFATLMTLRLTTLIALWISTVITLLIRILQINCSDCFPQPPRLWCGSAAVGASHV